MATGAPDQYWESARLPGIIKHGIVRRYLPIFLARTGSFKGEAFYFDGYAGRGFYENGDKGAAGMLLEWSLAQHERSGPRYRLRFFETNKESYDYLSGVCADFAAKGVDVTCERADSAERLDSVVAEADGQPLFLFVDPCGVALPYAQLVAALNRPRSTSNWPPTELLLNFSYEALRRIGGHVTSPKFSEATMQRLDSALGGDWWRAYFSKGVNDEAVEGVVEDFTNRLYQDANIAVVSLPVRRKHHHKPVYSLVFATRHNRGLWHFGDAVAKATDEHREALEGQATQAGLFEDFTSLSQKETDALPHIEQNILDLLDKHGDYVVGDYPVSIFGEYLGEVREAVVRAAVKKLHSRGQTSCDGKGGKPENLRILP